jgi:hypothetical protein
MRRLGRALRRAALAARSRSLGAAWKRAALRGSRGLNCKPLGVAYTSRACTAVLGGLPGVHCASIGVRAGPKRALFEM